MTTQTVWIELSSGKRYDVGQGQDEVFALQVADTWRDRITKWKGDFDQPVPNGPFIRLADVVAIGITADEEKNYDILKSVY